MLLLIWLNFSYMKTSPKVKKRPPTIVERNKKAPVFKARENGKSSLKIYEAKWWISVKLCAQIEIFPKKSNWFNFFRNLIDSFWRFESFFPDFLTKIILFFFFWIKTAWFFSFLILFFQVDHFLEIFLKEFFHETYKSISKNLYLIWTNFFLWIC